MTSCEIEASIAALSAKVWVREKDENGNSLIDSSGPQLVVSRWVANEKTQHSKGGLWRWTPIADIIELKGALLDHSGREHVPESKRDRSCQIHLFGFS
jgi:hypothetical protein